MNKLIDQDCFIDNPAKAAVVMVATSEYMWAKTTKEFLDKIGSEDLEKDYLVQFVDPDTVREEDWFKGYQEKSNKRLVPLFIWCQKFRIHDYGANGLIPFSNVVYRPIKKADIPYVSLD